jgi:hypothetical protein
MITRVALHDLLQQEKSHRYEDKSGPACLFPYIVEPHGA